MSHFDLTVSSATINQLLGFLSAKGFAVDFDAREFLIVYSTSVISYEVYRIDDDLWTRVYGLRHGFFPGFEH